MTNEPWLYEGQTFTEDMIGNSVGFVYIIYNKANNREYIGKKLFIFTKRKQVKGKKKKTRAKSDWETYYGSNKELLEDVKKHGPGMMRRTILRLCGSKSECNYYETKTIFALDAIINPHFYNSWVSCKINQNQLKILLDNPE